MSVTQEERNGLYWTHVDWELKNVTPDMIDWFWSNMEKGYILWHPAQHSDLIWAVKPNDKFIGAIHVAPQKWSDGTPFAPHIRFDDVASLAPEVGDVIVYEHAVAVAAIALFEKDFKPDNPIIAYRIHQWEKTDFGVRGRSSAIPVTEDPLEGKERGQVWAKHAGEECGNWGVFLPGLYNLYDVVKERPEVNPFHSLRVARDGKKLSYPDMKK